MLSNIGSGYILDILQEPQFDEAITRYEYHTMSPYVSNTLNNNDEIRIPLYQQDVYTLPCESYLYIEGKFTTDDQKTKLESDKCKLVNNAMMFLFDEIRYELAGKEINHVRNPGITTLMKTFLSFRNAEQNILKSTGISSDTSYVSVRDNQSGDFTFCIPLKMVMGVFEDYKKIIVNVPQELILLRSSNDSNVMHVLDQTKKGKITLSKVHWRIPFVTVSETHRVPLLTIVQNNSPIPVPYRKWQLHEYPTLPSTTNLIWPVKTTVHMDKPRYVIVGFQNKRKNNNLANNSHFDFLDLVNIKLYLNAEYYPYDNLQGNKSILYRMYSDFQSSYYFGNDGICEPLLDETSFLGKMPLFVIDCSKQNESLKMGPVDIRLEMEFKTAIPKDDVTAYCLILHDVVMEYTPLSSQVRKMM